MAAEYAHPVEFLLANFGTLAVGIPLVPSLPAVYMFTVLSMTHRRYPQRVHGALGALVVPLAPLPVQGAVRHRGGADRLLETDQEFRNLRDGDQV